ncbi:MAG: hypothetical protein Q4C52_09490 [Eubacteriales bacterium]|nr:hypothetical protein [Eubacteriales bacterium]
MKFEFIENENKKITTEQMTFLEDLILISDEIQKGLGLRVSPMQISGNTVRFNGIAANIRLNDTKLIVKPKVTGADRPGMSLDGMMATLYLRILRTCKSHLNSVIYFTSMSAESVTENTFVDCMAQYYLDKLFASVRKLPIAVYDQCEEKRSAIKGKILIQKELKSPIRDGRIWCRHKVMSCDNVYNALLKWCCKYFAENVSSRSLQYKLRQMADTLKGDLETLSADAVRRMRLPRNFDAYREPFSIAREIYLYHDQNTKLRTGNGNVCGYVINMERAFENILCYYMERFSVKKQLLHVAQADRILAKADGRGADKDIHIRPDDLLIKGESKLVLDAKYKQMEKGDKPAREDLYQMIASCMAHGTYEALLMYPCGETCEDVWTVANPVDENYYKIYIDKIDIFADDQTIIEQISRAVYRSRFAEVMCGKI